MMNGFEPRIAGFVCNWSAYSGLEMAGVNKKEYPVGINLIRLTCLGRLNLGLILKAFKLGADGVLLLGCPPDDCHYECGGEKAREVFAQTRKILGLLGIDQERLAFIEVPLGREDLLQRQLSTFIKRITKPRPGPDSRRQKTREASPV